MALKETLAELIRINNELTDSLEGVNSSILGQEANSHLEENEKLKKIIEQLSIEL